MPSPFPGMDPYLEGAIWSSVHNSLSQEIARQLSPQLGDRYVAWPTERFVLEEIDSVAITATSIYPDVGLAADDAGTGKGTATAMAPAPLLMKTVAPAPAPHFTVEIRDVFDRELVTAIEVLSFTNKHGDGRVEYLTKRRRLLLSSAHLIVIDLLHRGQRVPMVEPFPSAPYFVVLSRAERRPVAEVWPIALSAALPTIPVPLLSGDADVSLDLQAALTTIYDLLKYGQGIDYASPPQAPLPPEEIAFVEDRLRAAGLRQ